MPDTDTKIISLLERLSVVAPERLEVRYSDYFGTSGTYPIYFVSFAGERVRIADGPGDHHPLNWSNPAALLYAVLEEAHARELIWNVFQSVSLIDSSGIRVMTVGLSRNPSPIETTTAYLECLVLALEVKS